MQHQGGAGAHNAIRFKREISEEAETTTPRLQRQRRKFIRKLANNAHKDSVKPSDSSNDNINETNTHNSTALNESSVASTIKPSRRRIVVPIRRTRLPSGVEGQRQRQPDREEPTTTTTSKPLKRKVVMRRRLPAKPIAVPTPAVVTKTSLETVTTTTKQLRTLTILVTRVHDQMSEIISSTSVREQIKTVTDIVTRTQLETLIAPTQTARSFVQATQV